MTQAAPEIHCIDYWPEGIPSDKLQAYKVLIEAALIARQSVTVNRSTHATIVDYYSAIPHEWIRQELAKAVKER